MAHQVLAQAYLNITGPGDISTSVESIQVTHSQAEVDDTCMQAVGAQPFKARLTGLQDYVMAITLADNVTAGAIDATVWALWGTQFAVAWRYNNTTKTTSNPEYSGMFQLTNDGVGGQVGAQAKRTINIVLSSGVIARATS